MLGIKFHSIPIYDQTYIKVKVRVFEGKIKTNFLGNEIPKDKMHYTCIACITIDFVMKMNKKNYPQNYLEECKYRVKKIQMSGLINTELGSNSDDSDSDTKLMAKLELRSNSDFE